MHKVYINGTGSISAQNTFNGAFLEEVILEKDKHVLPLITPPYKEFISPGLIRRMSSGVKNSVVASTLALIEAQNPELDAIITGTGVGCIKDSEDFLTAILQNNEEFLTPTSFIQSTHNTIGAQIALGLKCKAYNMTYVQAAASFESALVDARLQLITGEANHILVGGTEEKAEKMYRLFELAGLIKQNSEGATFGEGATFFVLSNEKKEASYAEIRNVQIANKIDTVESFLDSFLVKCNLSKEDIDAIIVGKNDDLRFQSYFDDLLSLFPETVNKLHYKHLVGEYNTASAFGLWVAAHILKRRQIPEVLYLNEKGKNEVKNVLLYNQFRGLDHSLMLVSAC